MIRNKHTPLPLHQGMAVGNGGGINAAIDKGLNLVGLAATKTGSGEKERAYVVKQNSLLKGLLCIVILAVVVLIVVFSTVLELRVARRGLMVSEVSHHKKEHHDHEEIIRKSLELQEALHATIEETALIEEFRSYFEKAVGTTDDMVDKMFADSGASPKAVSKAKQMQKEFVTNVEVRLNKILNRFHERAQKAKAKVPELAKRMDEEIDHDADETKKYEEKLKTMGVDEQYAEKVEEQYEEDEEDDESLQVNMDDLTEEEKKMTPEQLLEKRKHDAEANGAEKEIADQLEVFFRKLNELTLPTIPPEKLSVLEQTLQSMTDQMEDESKEVDMDVVAKRMNEAIMIHAPGTLQETFDPAKHDSMLDFYWSFIERAKLAPHKQTLVDLYNGWKAPDSQLSALNVLAAIEGVAFKENLMKIFNLLEGEDMDPRTDTQTEHDQQQQQSGAAGGEHLSEVAKARKAKEKSISDTPPDSASENTNKQSEATS